ncbi:MAG: DUF2508 family protein [Clostridia bacterium]|nr:DUF2508 family protein [Clostridia bacterium]
MEKNSSKAKIFYHEFIRKPQPMTGKSLLLCQLRETSERLTAAHSRFENESDEDLLDSVIYEIQSLKALYRYLLKKAKEEGLQCGEVSVFGREVI